MRNDDVLTQPGDALDAATTALRHTPIPPGPGAEMLQRIEQLPAASRTYRIFSSRLLLTAAGIAGLILGLFVYFQLQRSSGLAFGDVVQAMDRAHTFTGKVDFPIPGAGSGGIPAGMHFAFKLFVRGQEFRAESIAFTAIANQEHDKLLVLIPLLNQAISTKAVQEQKKLDLYGMLREYRTGTEKAIGEKTIGGRKTVGFQVSRPADRPGQPADVWTFWVDPATKSPVQIDLLDRDIQDSISITDLQFDVPLDDALFDMKVPAGYTVTDPAANIDPWERRLYSGQVFDERGKPVAGVRVGAMSRRDPSGGNSNIGDPVTTDQDGRFSIDDGSMNKERISIGMDFTGKLVANHETIIDDSPVKLEFNHPDFVYAELGDLRLLPPEARVGLHVRLRDGTSIAARVVDSAGHPVAGAAVTAVYGKPEDREIRYNYCKSIRTNADGKFLLRGLAPDRIVLQVRKTDPASPPLWGQLKVDLLKSPKPGDIVIGPLNLPKSGIVHELFGMKLVDVDDDLRAQLSSPDFDKVLIVDPGAQVNRLRIGQPQQGDAIWMVNERRIKNFEEMANELLRTCESQKLRGLSTFRVQVLYDADRPDHPENGGGFITLNADDLAELQKVTARATQK